MCGNRADDSLRVKDPAGIFLEELCNKAADCQYGGGSFSSTLETREKAGAASRWWVLASDGHEELWDDLIYTERATRCAG